MRLVVLSFSQRPDWDQGEYFINTVYMLLIFISLRACAVEMQGIKNSYKNQFSKNVKLLSQIFCRISLYADPKIRKSHLNLSRYFATTLINEIPGRRNNAGIQNLLHKLNFLGILATLRRYFDSFRHKVDRVLSFFPSI